VLDPDAVLRPDEAALRRGQRTGWMTSEVRGAEAVARQFAGQAQAAQLALIDGAPGAVWLAGDKPRVAFEFSIQGGKVTEIRLVADVEQLSRLEIEILP
jgi:RNA polymerase sigma-70 factor (ECF subfamily)